ncbi:MAG: PQQ-binding-like beta-propeller repeat protein [Ktedonobacterales bacterium]
MERRRGWSGGLWVVAVVLVVAALVSGVISALRPDASVASPATALGGSAGTSGDWTQYRGDLAGTGNNPDASINTANVARLAPRWTFGPQRIFASTAAIVGGTVYAVNDKSLYAFDLKSGAALWHYDDIGNPYGAVLSSSVAVDPATHIAYYGTPDARVYAVNTITHQGVWNVQLGDPAHGAFIWSSPLLANGKLYIGLASHQDSPCILGAAFALDLATGAVDWRRDLAPAGTLGASVWSSISADATHHTLFVTTGNPCEQTRVIAQEDAIVGLDWDTGAVLWQYTALHDDSCDCDFGQGAAAFALDGGEYVVAGSKYGVVYAITPPAVSGQPARLMWSLRITGAGYLGGAGIYAPPAYADGRVFVAGGPTLDGACRGALWALDARTGAPLWRTCTAGQVVGAPAISGGVLFVPQSNVVVGYDVASGRTIWSAKIAGETWGGAAVAGSSLVVGTVSGSLYCFGLPG